MVLGSSARKSRHGIVSDELIQDGTHPTLVGHVAIAQDLLDQLVRRRALPEIARFGAATIDAAECAAHFGIDASRWALVCRCAAGFYERTAYAHHDPTECVAKARRYAAGRACDPVGHSAGRHPCAGCWHRKHQRKQH